MSKQWIKQQVRTNEVEDVVSKGIRWGMANRQTALASVGGTLAALALLGLILYRNKAAQNEAWDRLAVAQGYAFGGKPQESLKQISDLAQSHANTKAHGFAQLFAGDVHFRMGAFNEAIAAYAKVLEANEPAGLVPYALAGTGMTQEAAGKCQEALSSHQRFLDSYGDHFLAPQVHASLGRCQEELGQAELAKATLQKITLQYPDTPWAAWAQAKLAR